MQIDDSKWHGSDVLVTGGASFIGSHIVDKLISLGSHVTVVDNLRSGKIENLKESWTKIKFIQKDLEYILRDEIKGIFKDKEIVFHLAAVHGGRQYIATHPADVSSNFSIDHHVLEACINSSVSRVIFASSACVYPTKLQAEVGSNYNLKEEDSNPFNLNECMSADIEYGWAKLMTEMQMISFKKQYGMKGCPVRFVNAYGPRENKTHAVIALISKAVEQMDPYEIWGDGQQERDFTYVEDIVEGSILAAEKVSDCTPINLGTGRRWKIIDVVELICRIIDWRPSKFNFDVSGPVGPLSRALDNSRAKIILGWEPKYTFEEGLRRTINSYIKNHDREGKISKNILHENR